MDENTARQPLAMSFAAPAGGHERLVDKQRLTGLCFVLFTVALAAMAIALVTPRRADAEPHGSYAIDSISCTACHTAHTDQSGGFLKQPASGSTESAICLECHDGTGATTNIKNGADSFAQPSGHSIDEAATDLTSKCSSCHATHDDPSTDPKLPRAQINGSAVTSPGKAWCFACHAEADQSSWVPTGYPDTSAPSRDASGYPVLGTFPGKATYLSSAHSRIPTSSATQDTGDCTNCHAAHRGANKYDGLTLSYRPSTTETVLADRTNGTYAAACFKCHDGNTTSTAQGAVDIKSSVTTEAADESSWAGHRVKTTGGTLPSNAPLPCYDCHNPHGSKRGNTSLVSDERGQSLETSSAAGVRSFCFTCHSSSDGKVWDSATGAYAAVSTTAMLEGLRRDGTLLPGQSAPASFTTNWLRLRDGSGGHVSTDGRSCYECHGNDATNNVHDPLDPSKNATAGVDASLPVGGRSCYECHEGYQAAMEDGVGAKVGSQRTMSYHHVLGGTFGDGDSAPATSTYPASTSQVYCTSCHSDHNYFNGSRAANMRSSVASAGSETTNTDFVPRAPYGACVSCHSIGQTKPAGDQKSGGSTTTPLIDGAAFAASPHSFEATSGFSDGTTFRANCVKCHSDEQPKTIQTSKYTFGTHYSAEQRILAAMGAVVPAGGATEESACYKCHSTTANPNVGRDYYGVASMSATSQGIATAASQAYGHPFGLGSGLHTSDEPSSAVWSKRHIECEDCHNPHQAKPGARVVGSSTISPTMQGVRAIKPSWTATPWTAAASFLETSVGSGAGDYEAYVCFRCHTSYGGAVTGTTTSGIQRTDLSVEFNPANQSGHNVLGTSTTWPKETTASGLPYSWTFPTNAFTTATVPSMGVGYKMTCTDCHGNDAAQGARGPHGSSSKFMLVSGGTQDWWSYSLNQWSSTMCARCHNKASNNVHTGTQHGTFTCDMCHARVPHGWKRPRLLVRAGVDTAPYVSSDPRTLKGFAAKSYTPTGWQKTNCYNGCHSGSPAPPAQMWP